MADITDINNLRLRNLQEIVRQDLQQLIKSLLGSKAVFSRSDPDLTIFCIDSDRKAHV